MNWKPRIGMVLSNQQASLGVAGHRMLGYESALFFYVLKFSKINSTFFIDSFLFISDTTRTMEILETRSPDRTALFLRHRWVSTPQF